MLSAVLRPNIFHANPVRMVSGILDPIKTLDNRHSFQPNIMKDILKCKHPNSRKTKALAKKTKR